MLKHQAVAALIAGWERPAPNPDEDDGTIAEEIERVHAQSCHARAAEESSAEDLSNHHRSPPPTRCQPCLDPTTQTRVRQGCEDAHDSVNGADTYTDDARHGVHSNPMVDEDNRPGIGCHSLTYGGLGRQRVVVASWQLRSLYLNQLQNARDLVVVAPRLQHLALECVSRVIDINDVIRPLRGLQRCDISCNERCVLLLTSDKVCL